jgi:hypothetical protein
MISDSFAAAVLELHDFRHEQELSRAAAVLGGMRAGYRRNRGRSKPRRWTGFLAEGCRAWYGRRVLLPDGTVGSICAIIRGQAVARWDDPHCIEGARLGLFEAADLRPYRLPAAVALGKSKRGVKERPSKRKAQSARINGRMPTRPGRRRGRPRTSKPPSST